MSFKLYNPTGEPQTFLYGGHEYTVAPKSSDLTSTVANPDYEGATRHYQRKINGKLEVREEKFGVEEIPSDSTSDTIPDYESMDWNTLRAAAAKKKIASFGVKRDVLIAKLKKDAEH